MKPLEDVAIGWKTNPKCSLSEFASWEASDIELPLISKTAPSA